MVIAMRALRFSLGVLAAAGCSSERPAEKPFPTDPVAVSPQDGAEHAETAVAVARSGAAPSIVVSFNDYTIDPKFEGGPELTMIDDGERLTARRGLSLMGYSTSLDGGRTFEYRGKVRPPPGWSAIWGDPSVAVDPNQPSIVFMANLAMSDASWNNGSSGADSLLDPQTYSDGVCVARSTDGGITFPEIACVERPIEAQGECHPGQSVCVDHTAVGVGGDGRLYLAAQMFHQDGNKGSLIHLWRAPSREQWSALASADPQPPSAMDFEPTIVTAPNGDVWIAGVTRFAPHDVGVNQQHPGRDDWGSSGYVLGNAGVTDSTGAIKERVQTAPGTMFRIGRTFAIAVGERDGRPDIRLVYSAKRADGSFFLGAIHCAEDLADDRTCIREPAWETAALPGQQFMPSMSVGQASPDGFDLVFLTDDRVPAAPRAIQVAAESLAWSAEAGASVARERRLTPADWPVCTRLSATDPGSNYNGYWGDYFGTAQGVDFAGVPFSVTAFSDSRQNGGCSHGARFATPLHVAAARW